MDVRQEIIQNNGKELSIETLQSFAARLKDNDDLKAKFERAVRAMAIDRIKKAKVTLSDKIITKLQFQLISLNSLDGLIEQHSQSELDELGVVEGLSGKELSFADVARSLIDRIKQDGLYWQKPWKTATAGQAINFVSKKPYTGFMNCLVTQGYGNGMFLTLKQIEKLGGTLKKGAPSFPIWFATTVTRNKKLKRDSEGKPVINDQGEKVTISDTKFFTGLIQRFYTVYESIDIEGIDFPSNFVGEFKDVFPAEAIVRNWKDKPTISHKGTEAFYSPLKDSVTMPPKNSFFTPDGYYGTLFHELVHSTGAAKRLNRDLANKFGSNKYAREELVAELGSNFICSKADIEFATIQSAAYLKGWAKNIISESNKDPKFILAIMQDALKATNMIIGKTKAKKVKIEEPVPSKKEKQKTVKRRLPIAKKKVTVKAVKKPLPKAKTIEPVEFSFEKFDYLLRKLSELEQEYDFIKDDDSSIQAVIRANIPIISVKSAKRETGTKVGTKADINPGKVSTKTNLSVEGAADKIWENLTDEQQNLTSVEEIRDIIIDYLVSNKKKDSHLQDLEDRIKAIKDQMDAMTVNVSQYAFNGLSGKGTKTIAANRLIKILKGDKRKISNIKKLMDHFKKTANDKKNSNRNSLHGLLPNDGPSIVVTGHVGAGNQGIPDYTPIQNVQPAASQQSPRSKKIFKGSEIANTEYKTLEFEGRWADAVGLPSQSFSMMIWGLPKNGKTHFAMQFAKYLSRFGNVLYNASDEGISKTLQDKIKSYQLEKNAFVDFAELKNIQELEHEIKNNDYQFVFIDLVSTTIGLTPDSIRQLKQNYPHVGFILVFSSTKDGNFKGDNAWAHFPDVLAEVKEGVANITGRFGGGEYDIFNVI